ncbi:MAG TPA: pyridoxal-phosphate dependent enzyme, partial [Mycobacteriales bacterium]|nr:pyridoxal-phosphate dependent enzyme [Mycobacteriales bacterium]
MPGWSFACGLCERPHEAGTADYCLSCGAPVLGHHQATGPVHSGPGRGIWRYVEELPIAAEAEWLSLGESMTPAVPAPTLAAAVGVRAVWLKLDHLMTTGSFKDRLAAAGMAAALERSAPAVVCASSGNAAASVAAYAARAGIPAVIVVPEKTPAGKLAAATAYGAIPLAVPGDYSNSFALARELCRRYGLINLATTYINPIAVAALRSVAFDLDAQIGPDIDWVHVPTGSGPLVHGVAVGSRRLGRTPRLVAAQPEGCAPIASAFTRGADTVRPWPEVMTSVSGIDDPLRGYAYDGTITLREIYRSEGRAVAVADTAIRAAQADLAAQGIFVEPAAAASVAAMTELARRGEYRPDDVVVCLLTGHGL